MQSSERPLLNLVHKDYFHIEDVEARKILSLSDTQFKWFLKEISEFLSGPENSFLLRNGFDDFGSTRLLKFRSKVGWITRCVAWQRNKNLSFIHICSSVSRQGWKSFHKMLERFLMKHDYLIWYRNHLHASLQPPSESLEQVMLKGDA